jgi:hypothetical protein
VVLTVDQHLMVIFVALHGGVRFKEFAFIQI